MKNQTKYYQFGKDWFSHSPPVLKRKKGRQKRPVSASFFYY